MWLKFFNSCHCIIDNKTAATVEKNGTRYIKSLILKSDLSKLAEKQRESLHYLTKLILNYILALLHNIHHDFGCTHDVSPNARISLMIKWWELMNQSSFALNSCRKLKTYLHTHKHSNQMKPDLFFSPDSSRHTTNYQKQTTVLQHTHEISHRTPKWTDTESKLSLPFPPKDEQIISLDNSIKENVGIQLNTQESWPS